MKSAHWSDKYKHYNPCKEAMDYMQSKETEHQAYLDCTKGQWLHWLKRNIKWKLYAAATAAYAAAAAAADAAAAAATDAAYAAYAADAAYAAADKEADLIRSLYPTFQDFIADDKRMKRS